MSIIRKIVKDIVNGDWTLDPNDGQRYYSEYGGYRLSYVKPTSTDNTQLKLSGNYYHQPLKAVRLDPAVMTQCLTVLNGSQFLPNGPYLKNPSDNSPKSWSSTL